MIQNIYSYIRQVSLNFLSILYSKSLFYERCTASYLIFILVKLHVYRSIVINSSISWNLETTCKQQKHLFFSHQQTLNSVCLSSMPISTRGCYSSLLFGFIKKRTWFIHRKWVIIVMFLNSNLARCTSITCFPFLSESYFLRTDGIQSVYLCFRERACTCSIKKYLNTSKS